MTLPFGILPLVDQPWGFDGVRRERRGSYGDSRAFYVQPDHLEATDDNSGEDPAHPLSTITRAIALARAYMGDVIYVVNNDSWQYGAGTQNGIVETVIVPFDKPGISIIGVGYGGAGVYWQPALPADTILTINALDVVVKNFCFWGGVGGVARGIFCNWVTATEYGENTIIENCVFTDDLTIGIQLEFTYFVRILNNHFQGCGTAIYVDPLGNGIAFCQIIHNWFDNPTIAMAINNADNCLISGNQLYNVRAQGAALATNEGIDTTGGNRNLITGNFFSCLLPVPANGDWDDLNTGAATDAWVGNLCLNGVAVTTPT